MNNQPPITVHPTTEANWGNENVRSEGLHLRDYFAAKALSGICAHHDTWGLQTQEMADQAYRLADAMLKSRVIP